MNEKEFLEKYLLPSADRLDRSFTHPLPKIEGLKKEGDFIVQCELEDSFSTNIMSRYRSESTGVILKETYKNSQNKVTGAFVRLVGTLNIVKPGYPCLLLDAAVTNVDLATGTRSPLKTTVAIHFPQLDPGHRKEIFQGFAEQAKKSGVTALERNPEGMPTFWGPIFVVQSAGINFEVMRTFRDAQWNAYKRLIQETPPKTQFDYRPFQETMVFETSKRENLMFKKMGISVPMESQAAFFSVLVSGIG
jgi:hypothetical protein